MTKYFYFIIIFCFIRIAFAQTDDIYQKNPDSVIVYDNNHAFVLRAPKGWVISKGPDVYIYPGGYRPDKAPAIIEVRTFDKSIEGYETINKVIDDDVHHCMTYLKNPKIKTTDSIETCDKKWAMVKWLHYENDYGQKDRYTIAYVNEKKIVIRFAMYFLKENDYKKYFSRFKEVIKSYYLLSDSVRWGITEGYYVPYGIDLMTMYINFNNDSTFKYVEGLIYGFGEYKVTDDSLMLNFDTVLGTNFKLLKDTITVVKTKNSVSDTLIYAGRVLDMNNVPLQGAIVYGIKEKIELKYDIGAETDEYGNFQLRILKSELPITIKSAYVDYVPLHIIISDSLDKQVILRMRSVETDSILPGGTKYIFKIRNINDRFIEMKRQEEKYWMQYVKQTFRVKENYKMDTNRVEKIYELDKPPKCLNYDEIIQNDNPLFANISESIYVRVLIGTTGEIQKIEAINGEEETKNFAVNTVMKLKFTPGIKNGHAIKVWLCFPVYMKE